MRRQPFIESLGGSCRNWRWSWSFVNHEKKWVIFGAWTERESSQGQTILSDEWQERRGRKTPAYKESLDHIKLVQDGYALFTFRMERVLAYPDTDIQTSKIKAFIPEIEAKTLFRSGNLWIAKTRIEDQPSELDDIDQNASFPEGAKKRVTSNSYERSAKARALCLAVHGYDCSVCDMKLEDLYGKIARQFIHVHHLIPVSEMTEGYRVDPVKDLAPVCPNCHAVIHLKRPMLSLDEARQSLGRPST